jgi:hypothetical protein
MIGESLEVSHSAISPAPRVVGAVDVAVGLVAGTLAVLALPEIAVGGGVVAILGGTGALAGSVLQVSLGIVEFSTGLAVSGEAKSFVLGVSNPVTAWAAGLAALSGDPKIVQGVVEAAELYERLKSIEDLLHSPSTIEKASGSVNLFGKPIADKLIEDLAKPPSVSNKNTDSVNAQENPVSEPHSEDAGISKPSNETTQGVEGTRSPLP